jgi:hypothetical protein
VQLKKCPCDGWNIDYEGVLATGEMGVVDRRKRKRGRREMGVASLRVNRRRWWCVGRKMSECLRRRRRRERESDGAERNAMD